MRFRWEKTKELKRDVRFWLCSNRIDAHGDFGSCNTAPTLCVRKIYQIYQPDGGDLTVLAMRSPAAGKMIGRVGHRQPMD
jgi:hypothetical protein